MVGSYHFLVIDDDMLVQRALAAVLRKHGTCHAALSTAEAHDLLAGDYDGIIVDVRLKDGSGLDILEHARKNHIRTPAVVLSGLVDHHIVNRTALLDARLLAKPFGTTELAPFISDVVRHKTDDRIGAARERARHRWQLTEREVVIIDGALRGRTRGDNVGDMGITNNTYKTHVRKLLDKTDYSNLSSLAIDLLAER